MSECHETSHPSITVDLISEFIKHHTMEKNQAKDMEMVVRPRDVPFNKMKMPFMFLPYHIFAEWTNIAELVNARLKADEDAQEKVEPSPLTKPIDFHIRHVHRELHKLSWMLHGLDKLKFTCCTEIFEASIFRFDKIKSERIYNNATDVQRQFIFLPLPLLMHATNIRDIALLLHTKRFPEMEITEENLISIIDQMNDQMHKLNRWKSGQLDQLEFTFAAPKSNRNERKRVRPNKCTTKSPSRPANKSSRDEPQPSTSRDEPKPSTSRAYQRPPNDSTIFLSPQMHSTLLHPQKSIDPNLSTDNDTEQISKRTHKRLHEPQASTSAQSDRSGSVTHPKKAPNTEHISKRTRNRLHEPQVSTSAQSNTSDSVTHPKKAPNKALKRRQPDPSDKPTNVQRKVIEMDKKSFVENTNIDDLIQHKYGKLTKEEFQEKINHYFALRSEWDVWNQDECLRKLELKEDLNTYGPSNSNQIVVNLVDSDDDADEVTAKKPKILPATKPGNSLKLMGSSENVNEIISSPKSTDQKSDKCALTDSQSELYEKLSPLSLQQLIEKTNIRQLVQKQMEKCNANPALLEQNMKKGLDKMFKVVHRPAQWHNFELMQQLEFVNDESGPSSSSRKMNVKSSCQEKNDKSVQVEMSPIDDEPSGSSITAISESHHPNTNEASIQILPSTSSQALRPSEIEANMIQTELATDVSQNQSTNTTQYSTQIQCGQQSNPERVHGIPHTQSQSIDNNGTKDAAASDVDISDDDIIDITAIPVSTSTQKVQETNPIEQETQFIESGNAGHSQSMHNSSANGASQAERNSNFTESLPVPILTSTQIIQVENPETHNLKLSNNELTNSAINDGSKMKIKPEPAQILSNSQATDSDVICDGTLIEPIIVLQDTDDELMEMKELMNGTAIINGDSDSFGISNDLKNQEVEANRITVEELFSTLSGEPAPPVHADVVHSTTTKTSEKMSVKSDSTMRYSPLQSIENTINSKSKMLNKRPLSKRPIEKTSTTMDDTLSNFQPPKYNYPPLQLIHKQPNEAVRKTVGQKSTNVLSNEILCSSAQIDSDHGTPPTQASRCNVIEEFDSSGEINESNEKSQMESNVSKLLTQDNTWFANVNTQLIPVSNQQPSTSKQPITISTENVPLGPSVTAKSTEKSVAEIALVPTIPNQSKQDTIQYLHFINIDKFESKLVIKEGEQRLHTTLQLKYQCNGRSRINVTGESIRFILDVTENEWNAVNQVLSTIGDFTLNSNSLPSHKSILHRIIYYLFKTNSPFSKAHIAYSNELDYETARAFHKPCVIDNVDITHAFDPQFLETLKNFRNRMKN